MRREWADGSSNGSKGDKSKLNEESYEIAKMAVTEEARGKQVGRKLTEEAISRVGKMGAKVLFVRTDNRLPGENMSGIDSGSR